MAFNKLFDCLLCRCISFLLPTTLALSRSHFILFCFFLLAFTYIILMFLARIQYDIEWKANKIIKNECASVYALISSIGVCVSCIMVAGAAVNSIHFRFFCSYWGHNRWKYFPISFHQLEIKFFKHHHHHPRHWFFFGKKMVFCVISYNHSIVIFHGAINSIIEKIGKRKKRFVVFSVIL